MKTLTAADINALVTAAIAAKVSIALTTTKGRWISGPITSDTAADCGRMLLATYDRLLSIPETFRDPETKELHTHTNPQTTAALRGSYRYQPTPASPSTIATAIAIFHAAAYDAPFFDGSMTALFLDRLTETLSVPA